MLRHSHSKLAISTRTIAALVSLLLLLVACTQEEEPTHVDSPYNASFIAPEEWGDESGVQFQYFGLNTGEVVTMRIHENRGVDAGPAGWQLVWSDEFNADANTPPNPDVWTYETGGRGWGNNEWQYYTDKLENAAHDGEGNMVITADVVDPNAEKTLFCWNGRCSHTSARLITRNKLNVQYGRIEARMKIPFGQGIWPAFWMLGSNFGRAGWPGAGEIDIMENIGRERSTVHGTVHGPGYAGGDGITGKYSFRDGTKFADDFYLYAIEWEENEIRWYVDGELFHTVTPSAVPGDNNWVYNHPFFLLLNIAVGGQWPGYPDDTTTFPQTLHVDYIRIYQAPDTSERFEATFVDDFIGWQEIEIRFDALTRSAEQPEGAPDDGFTGDAIWGYSFLQPTGYEGAISEIEQVELFTKVGE